MNFDLDEFNKSAIENNLEIVNPSLSGEEAAEKLKKVVESKQWPWQEVNEPHSKSSETDLWTVITTNMFGKNVTVKQHDDAVAAMKIVGFDPKYVLEEYGSDWGALKDYLKQYGVE